MTIYQIEAWCKNLLNTIQYHILHWFNQLDVWGYVLLGLTLVLSLLALALVKRRQSDKALEFPVKPRPNKRHEWN